MGFHYKSGSITYFEAFAASSKELCKALRDYPLILAFGWLDIKKKYNRSVLGPFWITLYMGIVIATLGVIFGQVLHLPLREYLPFLTLGYIIWGFIASVLKESCSVFAASEGIIKQLSLSPFFYLLRLFWRNLVIFFHNLLIFPLVCVVVSCPIEISSLLVIPGFIILCVNLFWLSIVISFLCARYRDCKQIVDAFVLILFYVSPVIWMPTALSPKSSVFILAPNPAYHLISIVRSPLLGMYPSLASWLISLVMGCLGMVLALCVFGKYRRSLSYWL